MDIGGGATLFLRSGLAFSKHGTGRRRSVALRCIVLDHLPRGPLVPRHLNLVIFVPFLKLAAARPLKRTNFSLGNRRRASCKLFIGSRTFSYSCLAHLLSSAHEACWKKCRYIDFKTSHLVSK